ncbi:MAG: (2Fe-2S)-binding protein [Symbiobacteriaceae bacterium]|nr:(2Fe-2S)-binding protein [Symbiobacteriaceae bacterium]
MDNVPPDDTIICRCSDVTRAELRAWIAHGLTSMDELKRLTRITMGPCQGRTCRHLVMQELAAVTGQPLEELTPSSFRQPLKGITLGAVADWVAKEKQEKEV